jgi:hypothetical protein
MVMDYYLRKSRNIRVICVQFKDLKDLFGGKQMPWMQILCGGSNRLISLLNENN